MIWLLMAMALLGDGEPASLVVRQDQLYLHIPKAIMEDPGLGEHLHSGLTTTFQLVWTLREKSKPLGMIRMDIRYEPWDEVYFLTLLRSDGHQEAFNFANQKVLIRWWTEYQFPLSDTEVSTGVEFLWVTLRVIPFSQQEQEMAREWLTPQNNKPDSGLFSGRTGNQPTAEQQRQNNLLRIMFATSIQREAIKSYKWKVKLP